ncbi:GtrA family protein [Vibrio plantisponsor]|uniref:GtrA family protein n=1 Tax=Vibrio plantisponsor TaxID=664643 RepID=A0ABU4IKD2_9VIBR|nr:GtrA family protein [Vibrio plantisponsor]MDW6018302.1 GtrA family protein [Vibrio plantisponsor]NNM42472.1 GtrA family protein [Vibrio plantisponsor]
MINLLFYRAKESRLIRYAVTGGVATLIHITIAFSSVYFFQSPVFIANVLGFSTAFIFSYISQTVFVFRQSIDISNGVRFFLVQFLSLIVAQLSSEMFVFIGSSYLKIIVVVVILPLVTYVIHKIWTFAPDK